MSGVLDTRYKINGVIDTNNTVLDNIESLCTAAGTWLTYDNHLGQWSFVINRAGESVASFSDSNIIGAISVSGTGLNDLYNSVKFEFPHIDLRDEPDFVNIEIPDSDRNANEPDNTLNLKTNIINDPVQAEIIALQELKQSRVDRIISFKTDYSMIHLKAGDIIDVTNEYYGFAAKRFRIVNITETDDDGGELIIAITALEYDPAVYETSDISRYTVTDSTGIVTIGNIGRPGTPTVITSNIAARPHFVATSTSPTGIVEAMEFWYTTDVPPAVTIDSNRTYNLLKTVVPTVGNTFAFGTAVTMDYDQLATSNFLIKTRGVNKDTVGRFSEPSGTVYYAPVQATDAITPDTQAISSTGSLLTALSVLSLLNRVDGLFSGNTSVGGIFDKVFDLFKGNTGYDIRGNAGNIAKVTAGNVSSISKVIQSETFSANITKNTGFQSVHTTAVTPVETGLYNIRIYQDVNSSACNGGRGSPLDTVEDIAGLAFDVLQGNTTVINAATGGPGVMYWQDFMIERNMTLTSNTTYDLEIFSLYNPSTTSTTYQSSDITYTVTKIG